MALPIDPHLPRIVAGVREERRVVLAAEPGAGKTTRVPRALWESGHWGEREIWVVQPRRLAASLAARWVASELGESVGETIGYQVRFEDVTSRATRVRFMSDGVFLRRLIGAPSLPGVGVVVLDEFHERRLAGDVGLALLVRLQREQRPDLGVVVMSATLDVEALAAYLEPCARFEVEGRTYPVEIEHARNLDDRPLEVQVASAVRTGLGGGGDVLVFLPGVGEIDRAARACADLARERDVLVLPLHGSLPIEEQQRAVAPAPRRGAGPAAVKVVLSTNVAETSVTIDGVSTVVDSGLHRVAGHDPWSGLSTLRVAEISRAAATQRAGRAGRTGPGRCLRLYTKNELERRPTFEVPELVRLDLTETVLLLRAAGLEPRELEWLEAPPATALDAGDRLLTALGALTAQREVTDIGRALLRIPAHPRLGRLLLSAHERGAGDDGALIVALLAEASLRPPTDRHERARSDLLAARDRFAAAARARLAPERLRPLGIAPAVARRVQRAREQLRRSLRGTPSPAVDLDAALLRALLDGFPDRVAQARTAGGERRGRRELLLASGGRVQLGEGSVAVDEPFVVVVDAEERGRAGGRSVVARAVSAVEPDWLLELEGGPFAVTEVTELEWNGGAGRVDRIHRLAFGALTLDEQRGPAPSSPEAGAVLAAQTRSIPWPVLLGDDEAAELESLLHRTETLRAACPDLDVPTLGEAGARAALDVACRPSVALADLRGGVLAAAVRAALGPELGHRLDALLPAHVTLPGGRRLAVHYEPDRSPWVESYLQDFFGMREGPRIAAGRLPLTLHLLAPNRRAVQVTTDLSGFWTRHYPELRRALARRYPRHAWPDDPERASPPAPGARRPR